jgi:hypothetical protein
MSEVVEASEPASELGTEAAVASGEVLSPGVARMAELFAWTHDPFFARKKAACHRVANVLGASNRLIRESTNARAKHSMFMATSAYHSEKSYAAMEHYMTLAVKHIEAQGPDDLRAMMLEVLDIVSFPLSSFYGEDAVPPGGQLACIREPSPLEHVAEDVLSAPVLEGSPSADACITEEE